MGFVTNEVYSGTNQPLIYVRYIESPYYLVYFKHSFKTAEMALKTSTVFLMTNCRCYMFDYSDLKGTDIKRPLTSLGTCLPSIEEGDLVEFKLHGQ